MASRTVAPGPSGSVAADPAAAGGGTGSSPPSGAGGAGVGSAFGAAGPGGVRNLAVAFTRAIPIAASGDPVWGSLPDGSAGAFDLKITVDEDGRIASAVPSEASIPAHMQALVQRTLVFLRAGRFALSHVGVAAGVQTLRVAVSVSQVEGGVPDDESSAGPYALGFEPPSAGKPGRAYFTLRSGRHVEVLVTVIGAG